jgi:hypothetical protein
VLVFGAIWVWRRSFTRFAFGISTWLPPSPGAAVRSSLICDRQGPERIVRAIKLEAALDVASIAVHRIIRSLTQEARATSEDRCALIELLAAELAIELGRHFEPVEDQPVRGGLAPGVSG